MYCVNCGVKLADTEKSCPLCGVRAIHPDLDRTPAAPLYPPDDAPYQPVNTHVLQIIITGLFVLAALVCFLCDLQFNPTIDWSGLAMGGLGVFYCILVLPGWFKKPNPVVFIPIVYAAILGYLLYIDLWTGGHWFMTFSLPVVGFLGFLSTSVAGILRYVRRGALVVIGIAAVCMGGFMPVMGFLLNLTFFRPSFAFWSLYPAAGLAFAGGFLIYLGLCRSARQALVRKFFI